MKNLKITNRLLLWFLGLSLLPLFVLNILLFNVFEARLYRTVLQSMEKIADRKADQIDAYFHERIADARMLAHSPHLQEAMAELTEAFRAGSIESVLYRKADARYRKGFDYFLATGGYADLLLIDTASNVVFTLMREEDYPGNLLQRPDSSLARAVRQTLSTLEAGVSDFELHAAVSKPTVFVTAPIVAAEHLIGSVVLRIDIEPVYHIVEEDVGFGHSEETTIARADGDGALFLKPLKYGSEAAHLHRTGGAASHAEPLQRALRGGRGNGIVLDYRGEEVIAVWRYLPRPRWGMVMKIDAREVFGVTQRLWAVATGLAVMVLCVMVLAALYLGREIVSPIKALTHTATAIARGDLTQRVGIQSRDELQELADAFNQMAAQLQASHEKLEQRVTERTLELHKEIAERRKAEEQANAANRAKSAFLANMSHELRTPLNAILGFAQIMEYSPQLPEKHIQPVQGIISGGNHLLTLINDVLDLAKVEAGHIELFPEEVCVQGFFQEIVEIFRLHAERKGLVFEYRADTPLPSGGQIDPKRLRQIAMNLLGNAVKFTDHGSIRLNVGFKENCLSLSVCDTCLQLAQDLQPHLVLMDLRMQELDGLETSRRLLALPGLHALPVIMVSASAFEEDREAGRAAGCVDYLAKLVKLGLLLQALGKHLPLAWKYAPASAAPVKPQPQDVPFSDAQREDLAHMLEGGDVNAIIDYLEQLTQIPDCPGQAHELLKLAENFHLQEIRRHLAIGKVAAED